MDTRTRRASWDAATDAKPRKRHGFRHLKDGPYAAKQRPGFQTRMEIPEVGAIHRVDNHAKAISYSSVYAVDRVDSHARATSYSSFYAVDLNRPICENLS
jgi:hypothetical protein